MNLHTSHYPIIRNTRVQDIQATGCIKLVTSIHDTKNNYVLNYDTTAIMSISICSYSHLTKHYLNHWDHTGSSGIIIHIKLVKCSICLDRVRSVFHRTHVPYIIG